MVRHIVMWNIQDSLDKEEVYQTIKEKLEGLKEKIDFLKEVEVGRNFNQKETGHDIVLCCLFENQKALEDYIVHPAHVEAGKYVRSVVCDRVDADFYTQA